MEREEKETEQAANSELIVRSWSLTLYLQDILYMEIFKATRCVAKRFGLNTLKCFSVTQPLNRATSDRDEVETISAR